MTEGNTAKRATATEIAELLNKTGLIDGKFYVKTSEGSNPDESLFVTVDTPRYGSPNYMSKYSREPINSDKEFLATLKKTLEDESIYKSGSGGASLGHGRLEVNIIISAINVDKLREVANAQMSVMDTATAAEKIRIIAKALGDDVSLTASLGHVAELAALYRRSPELRIELEPLSPGGARHY